LAEVTYACALHGGDLPEEVASGTPLSIGSGRISDATLYAYHSACQPPDEGPFELLSTSNPWREMVVIGTAAAQATDGHEIGSWDPVGEVTSRKGRIYATALAIMTLTTLDAWEKVADWRLASEKN